MWNERVGHSKRSFMKHLWFPGTKISVAKSNIRLFYHAWFQNIVVIKHVTMLIIKISVIILNFTH